MNRIKQAMVRVAGTTAAFVLMNMPAYAAGAVLRGIRRRPLQKSDFHPEQIQSILVVRVDGLGDVVILSGFLRGLRKGFPSARITLVVDEKILSFVELCPWVNEVIGFNEQGSKYKRLLLGSLRAWRFARTRLHARSFDLAVNPRWDIDSRAANFLGYFSMARRHIGFSEAVSVRKAGLNRGTNRFYSHLVAGSTAVVTEQQRNNEVLARLGVAPDAEPPELWLSEEDCRWAGSALQEHGVKSADYLVCFGVGGVEPKRLWPIDRFGEIADWLLHQMEARILIIGDSRDQKAAEPLVKQFGNRVVNLAGVCSLRKSAALLRHCHLFVGNDSGPMHMATAAGVPVVEISCHPVTGEAGHVNSPVRYPPLGVISRVVQPRMAETPCVSGCGASSPHCILDIQASDVRQAITEVLTQCGYEEAQLSRSQHCSK